MALNGLLSTILSSTAALVAIIGGFLVSRVITLSSEKNRILKKIVEIDKELSTKMSLYESARQVVQDEDIDDFVHEYAEEILFNQKTIEDILNEDHSINLKRDEIEAAILRVTEIYSYFGELIISRGEKLSYPSDFNDFTRDNHILIKEDRRWHEIIYNLLYKHIDQQSSSSSLFDAFNHSTNLPVFKTIASSQQYMANTYKMKTLEDDMLKGYGKISGLWSGLAVLVYACIVGIVIPSYLLPYPLNYFDDSATKIVILSLFYSELLAIFSYLGITMYRLTKHDS